MLPLVNKYRPDTNKAIYLTTYDSLVTAVQNMVNNDKVYPMSNNANAYYKFPLSNQVAVTIDGTTIEGNSAKFCNALALSLNTVGTVSCNTNYNANPAFTKSFQTTNGVVFQVLTKKRDLVYQSDVYIDINGENKGKNCFYSDNCKNPDRFKFYVAASGKVYPADQKGQSYVDTRTNPKLTGDTASNYTALAELPNNEKWIVYENQTTLPTGGDKGDGLIGGGVSIGDIDKGGGDDSGASSSSDTEFTFKDYRVHVDQEGDTDGLRAK
jgi:uncharacterized pyridoxamine 5'-phosphate oxidase family protein